GAATLMARLPCVGARSVTYRRSGRPETPAIHPAGRLYGWVSLPPSGWEPCAVAASWERWGNHTSAARQARAVTRPDHGDTRGGGRNGAGQATARGGRAGRPRPGGGRRAGGGGVRGPGGGHPGSGRPGGAAGGPGGEAP